MQEKGRDQVAICVSKVMQNHIDDSSPQKRAILFSQLLSKSRINKYIFVTQYLGTFHVK